MSPVLRHYLISGRVQGVGYRAFSQRQAQSLGLNGWVRNLRSGQVEVLAEGSEFALGEFLKVLQEGPPAAKVAAIQSVDLTEPMELTAFEVIEDGEEAWQKESFV
jgi:acylphosphatase